MALVGGLSSFKTTKVRPSVKMVDGMRKFSSEVVIIKSNVEFFSGGVKVTSVEMVADQFVLCTNASSAKSLLWSTSIKLLTLFSRKYLRTHVIVHSAPLVHQKTIRMIEISSFILQNNRFQC